MSHKKLKDLTKEKLIDLYHNQLLKQSEIAKKYKVHQGAIYYWMKKWGIPTRDINNPLRLEALKEKWKGEKNPRWTGGSSYTWHGYRLIRLPDHPRCNGRGYVLEHHLVWEHHHSKPLPKGWIVHHLNGDKTDNRIENLHAMSSHAHNTILNTYERRIAELEKEIEFLKSKLVEVSYDCGSFG
jgi:hypothetical protein